MEKQEGLAEQKHEKQRRGTHFETVPVTDALRKISNDNPLDVPVIEKSSVKDDPYTFNLIRWIDERSPMALAH